MWNLISIDLCVVHPDAEIWALRGSEEGAGEGGRKNLPYVQKRRSLAPSGSQPKRGNDRYDNRNWLKETQMHVSM